MKKNASTPPSLPFVSDDYHLIISEEEFNQYKASSMRRKWMIGGGIATLVLIILSISIAVIPAFLKAHLSDLSADATHIEDTGKHNGQETTKAIVSEKHYEKNPTFTPTVQMKAVYD